MRIRFTPHALVRMRERGVMQRDVRVAIEHPERCDRSLQHAQRFLAVRTYRNRMLQRVHALLVVYEQGAETITVVTVVDTSKIEKYL